MVVSFVIEQAVQVTVATNEKIFLLIKRFSAIQLLLAIDGSKQRRKSSSFFDKNFKFYCRYVATEVQRPAIAVGILV